MAAGRRVHAHDLDRDRLPQRIRQERRSEGRYASIEQVRYELRGAEALFRRYQIDWVDTTGFSIEEIASKILSSTGIERRVRP